MLLFGMHMHSKTRPAKKHAVKTYEATVLGSLEHVAPVIVRQCQNSLDLPSPFALRCPPHPLSPSLCPSLLCPPPSLTSVLPSHLPYLPTHSTFRFTPLSDSFHLLPILPWLCLVGGQLLLWDKSQRRPLRIRQMGIENSCPVMSTPQGMHTRWGSSGM